ncbi:MAG TPA: P1 family peptidase [Gemmatimonadaceae bacterium]|nr:P1 family peptidase [Gemmatimonadaceae bacterium]
MTPRAARRVLGVAAALSTLNGSTAEAQAPRRARELGVAPGIFRTGALNAITDVSGVRVGHATVMDGDSVRTGVTAILPHGGNTFLERVPAAMYVGNGFGKLLGITQVRELGEIETPILLTCTLCVWKAADAMVGWMLRQPGMEQVRSVNPIVGETNDGSLNATRWRPITPAVVESAIVSAASSAVREGSVGAGIGTVAFGWKGGIGTSSRVLPRTVGGWTVGVLVQSNFGGVFQVLGAPVGKELRQHAFRDDVASDSGDGSIMIVVATDAPLSDRNLERLAARAIMGLARTGSSASNGSGDYVIAFSTAESVRRRFLPGVRPDTSTRAATRELPNDGVSALFQGVVEATEEAIYNSLFAATTVSVRGRTVEAIPIDSVRRVLRKYGL